MKAGNQFYEIVTMMPVFQNILSSVPKYIADKATEIRIRTGKPVIIETTDDRYICGGTFPDTNQIYSCIRTFCDYSIHSFQREFSEGWITLKSGHRAGFCGTAYATDGTVSTIKDISSLNIRIAREHIGISDNLFYKTALDTEFKGLVIAGAPLSGKTSLLRDYCRNCGNRFKTALIDERAEIASVFKGVPQNQIGLNTDILNCYDKKNGIEQAIRVLSPQIIICDEIGSETDNIINLTNCGVKYVFTVHCSNLHEAKNNKIIHTLIERQAVNYITFLENKGKMKGLWFLKDGKNIDSCNDGNNLLHYRGGNSCKTETSCNRIEEIYCNA